jgi:hypothetical protein
MIKDKYEALNLAATDMYTLAMEDNAEVQEDAWITSYSNMMLSAEEWGEAAETCSKKALLAS